MTLSYSETKMLFELVLCQREADAQQALNIRLRRMGRKEPEFYAGVIKHCPDLEFGEDQWFDFLSKITNRGLRDESRIISKLSERQREALPPATYG